MSNTQHTAGHCRDCGTRYEQHHCGCYYCPACWTGCPRCGWARRQSTDATACTCAVDSFLRIDFCPLHRAAPDLLDALELTLGALEAWMEIAEPHDMRQGDEHAASLARVAIRNARGLNRPKSP